MIRDTGAVFEPKFKSRKHLVELSLSGYNNARNVYVIDDFCCWFPGAQPMVHEDDTWKITIPLYEGDYRYAFSVNGYVWLKDPGNPQSAKIPYGSECSFFKVGQEALAGKTVGKDEETGPKGLYHDQTSAYLSVNEDAFSVRFRTQRGSSTGAALIVRRPRESIGELEMHKAWEDTYFEYYECSARLGDYPTEYFFKAENVKNVAFFSAAGASTDLNAVVNFLIDKSLLEGFNVPPWAVGTVFYQIFPDRFCNGDRENDPPRIAKWDDKPTTSNFFGGDLKGIIAKLDHLQALNVQAIYLTPIFKSNSNHKYDTLDYFQVDPHFGTNETLKQLVKEAHARGMRVILDAVFHHTSDGFWAFRDLLKNQEKSKYSGWYLAIRFPVRRARLIRPLLRRRLPLKLRLWLMSRFPLHYETFAGVSHMPKLNLLNAETAEYFMKIAEYWIQEADIDGWRFDVAFGIPYKFWRKLRARLKRLKSDAYLVGEFGNGNPDPSAWVGPEAFDAVMNYPLRTLILDFAVFERIKASEFLSRFTELAGKLPKQASCVMYNLLGSHDTPRLLTVCKGDIRRAKLAMLLQMTLPGAPAIYYGDEVGLEGGADPDCRRTMPWDRRKWNMDLFNYCMQLVQTRKDHPSIRVGDFNVVSSNDENNILIFERNCVVNRIVVAVNNGLGSASVPIKTDGDLVDILTNETYKVHNGTVALQLAPKQGRILHESKINGTEELHCKGTREFDDKP